VAWEDPDAVPALLRRLPWLGRLVPPQILRWKEVATYRVRLRAAPAGTCTFLPCYESVVPDVTPAAPEKG
jgi:hypothetical protein